MRTAVVNWTDRRAGGAESYLSVLLPALRDRGHDVLFWHERSVPADRGPVAGITEAIASGATAREQAGALAALDAWRPDVLFVHGLTDPALEAQLLDIAPAVFFGHNYYGTCISGTKMVARPAAQPCARRFGPACMLQFYPRRCGGLNPLTMIADYARHAERNRHLRRYRGVVVVSDHMRREYVANGVDERRVHCVPPIVETITIGPQRAVPQDRARLLFMGRLDRLKGCHTLIEALPAVQASLGTAVELIVAGDGPELARCRDAAKGVCTQHSTITIGFPGWVAREHVPDLLSNVDAVVMPSLWPEPLGLSGLEAVRAGIPVAAFAVGGIPEWLVDGVNGALADAHPPTASGLARAVVRTLREPALMSFRTGQHRAPAAGVEAHLSAIEPILAEAAGVPHLTAEHAHAGVVAR